jgi:hypothetical protein
MWKQSNENKLTREPKNSKKKLTCLRWDENFDEQNKAGCHMEEK